MFPRSRSWRRVDAVVISVISLFVGRAFYLLGDAQSQGIGLVFFGLAVDGLVSATVLLSDWFTDLDESMRISTVVWVAPFLGLLIGYVLDGLPGTAFGMIIAVLLADAVAVPLSVYFHLRDKRMDREYEEEMRKYGKEP